MKIISPFVQKSFDLRNIFNFIKGFLANVLIIIILDSIIAF